jgi:hypothetical protein
VPIGLKTLRLVTVRFSSVSPSQCDNIQQRPVTIDSETTQLASEAINGNAPSGSNLFSRILAAPDDVLNCGH